MNKTDIMLYELLVNERIVDKKLLDDILKQENVTGPSLIELLVDRNLINEKDVLRLLSEKVNIPYRSIRREEPKEELFKKIPIKIAWYYQFMPLYVSSRVLTIAVYYPLDIKTQDEIRLQLGYDIEMILCEKKEVINLLKKNYGLGADTLDKIFLKDDKSKSREIISDKEELQDLDKIGEDATIANLVNQIIFDAYKSRATDIHIEPYRDRVRFRYRIDGILYDANVSSKIRHFISSIITRIKIMSNIDIVEHRIPQDGQAVVKTKEGQLDLRISFIPTPYGQSVVIRILPTAVLYDIDKLGLEKSERKTLERLLEKPHGIIFVTGPTGSGKTTTLYACLNKIKIGEQKIITIEDPIEYEMDGITQIQVNSQVGLTFAAGLRSVLRHDPDIIMVGEVRDKETADIAIRVALTGHLVFSTLHTNSAATSIHRLMDIGIEPYLIYSSTIAFIAQRLVRVLCPKCKTVDPKPNPKIVEFIKTQLGMKANAKVKLYKNVGCDHCNNTGYYGRIAIYEILEVTENIKRLIAERVSASEIEREAISNNMTTVLQSGLKKVVEGITTIEDIMTSVSMENLMIENMNSETLSSSAEEGESVIAERNKKKESDKRIYARLDESISIRFSIFKNISGDTQSKLVGAGISEEDFWNEHNTISENISSGGLLFRHTLPLFPGLVIDMKMIIPMTDGKEKKINCLAKVVRSYVGQKKGLYHIAVCFLDMASSDRTVVNEFVKDKLTERFYDDKI